MKADEAYKKLTGCVNIEFYIGAKAAEAIAKACEPAKVAPKAKPKTVSGNS